MEYIRIILSGMGGQGGLDLGSPASKTAIVVAAAALVVVIYLATRRPSLK